MQIERATIKLSGPAALLLNLTIQASAIAPAGAQIQSDPAAQVPGLQLEQPMAVPPEVIPTQPAQMNSSNMIAPAQMSGYSVPGLATGSLVNANPNMMSPRNAQGYKQALINSLMAQGGSQQFQGQQLPSNSFNAPSIPYPNASNNGTSLSPNTQANGASSQTLSQSDWITPNQQYGAPNNQMAAHSQTLSGSVQNTSAPSSVNRQGAGFSHGIGLLTGFGMSALGMGMALRGSPMSMYTTGLTGVGLMNYGMRSGFNF